MSEFEAMYRAERERLTNLEAKYKSLLTEVKSFTEAFDRPQNIAPTLVQWLNTNEKKN